MLDDPSVHNWVKLIAQKLQEHDPVDALHDCELLVAMCKARLEKPKPKKQKDEKLQAGSYPIQFGGTAKKQKDEKCYGQHIENGVSYCANCVEFEDK